MTKSDTGSERPGEWVFVYGTLRQGGSNAFRMEGAEFIGTARVEGALYAISWYPGLILGKDPGHVIGEVYQVGPEQMRALDEFEGLSAGEIEGSEYRRVKVPVRLEDFYPDASHRAWVYEWKGPVDDRKLIRSGDWLDIEQPSPKPVFTWLAACASLCQLPFFHLAVMFFHGGSRTIVGFVWGLVAVCSMPLMGLYSVRLAKRRREPLVRLRAVATMVCSVWLLLCAFVVIRWSVGLIR